MIFPPGLSKVPENSKSICSDALILVQFWYNSGTKALFNFYQNIFFYKDNIDIRFGGFAFSRSHRQSKSIGFRSARKSNCCVELQNAGTHRSFVAWLHLENSNSPPHLAMFSLSLDFCCKAFGTSICTAYYVALICSRILLHRFLVAVFDCCSIEQILKSSADCFRSWKVSVPCNFRFYNFASF